jgi:type II restriction enzyme
MPKELAERFSSPTQQTRVISEAWAERELFCAACTSPNLKRTPNNTRCTDLICANCESCFELKAGAGKLPAIIPDGAYESMIASIRANKAPNLLLLRYDLSTWRVTNLLLIPKFAFPESAIIRRKPLGPNARRAGWTGCNISLVQIPADAKIAIISAGLPRESAIVRHDFQRISALSSTPPGLRSWALELLNLIRSSGLSTFSTRDAYVFESELQQLHPHNRNIRPKIRQQLQVLRDAGILSHPERGIWSVRNTNIT